MGPGIGIQVGSAVVVGSGVWIAIGGDVFVWVESESELGILVELPVNDEV